MPRWPANLRCVSIGAALPRGSVQRFQPLAVQRTEHKPVLRQFRADYQRRCSADFARIHEAGLLNAGFANLRSLSYETNPEAKFSQARQPGICGRLSGGWIAAAAPARIVIIADPADKLTSAGPVQWAIGELRRAVEAKGATSELVATAGAAGQFQTAVVVGRPETNLPAEAFRLAPAKQNGKPVVRASASDSRGLVYAITELADRVQHGTDPVAALALTSAIQEQPANSVRSINKAFVSDVEDKSWYYDRDYWRDYLSTLATNRFNRFSLAFGWGYDFPRNVVGDYFHLPYPYLVEVPGYNVRVIPLEDGERERNLEALRFIVEQTAARGLEFQLALWTHAYEWTDSPRAQHRIEGLTPETHAAYCRDALALLLKTCPESRGSRCGYMERAEFPKATTNSGAPCFKALSAPDGPSRSTCMPRESIRR